MDTTTFYCVAHRPHIVESPNLTIRAFLRLQKSKIRVINIHSHQHPTDCAAKAKEIGAEIITDAHDVINAGRMLMLKVPVGATVALWQGNEHKSCNRSGELNTPYWHELATRDSKVSREFYCALLGWESEIKPMEGMDYTLFLVDGQPIAGMLEMTSEWPESIPAHWMIYFAVESCDATVSKAASLGGQVCVPAKDIPEVGRFSVICDSQGAVFSVIESVMDDV